MTNGIPFGLILPVYDIIGSTPATGVAVPCCTGRVLVLIVFKKENDVYHEVKGCVYNIFKKGVCKITLIENFVNIFCHEMSDLKVIILIWMFPFSFLSDHDKRSINLKNGRGKNITFYYNRLHTNVYDLKPRSVDKYIV